MPQEDDSHYGEEIYFQVYKQGNKRYETKVFLSSAGAYTAVFRKYFRKAGPDGRRVTHLNQETLVKGEDRDAFKRARFPDYPEAIKLLHSDFFKTL